MFGDIGVSLSGILNFFPSSMFVAIVEGKVWYCQRTDQLLIETNVYGTRGFEYSVDNGPPDPMSFVYIGEF